jgi:phage major head subunit gpT-like protein
MDLTPATLRALRTSFSKMFEDAYSQTTPFYSRLCTQVPSTTAQNDYGWMAKLPGMREWLGERVVHNLATHSYQLKNKDYELTVGVDRNDIEDDNLGQYSMLFARMGESVSKHPDQLVKALLVNGAANLCFDGLSYFNAAHPVNPYDAAKGTYSNYSSTGLALTQANFLTARATMATYKGEDGEPLGVVPNLLVVPPALEGMALRICKMGTIHTEDSSGESASAPQNVTAGMADVLMLPELAGADTTWYLLATQSVIKPLVFQWRKRPVFVSKVSPTDDNVFHTKQFVYGADGRYNAGYTLPFLAYKAVA